MTDDLLHQLLTIYGPLGLLAGLGWFAFFFLLRRMFEMEDQLRLALVNNTTAMTVLAERIGRMK